MRVIKLTLEYEGTGFAGWQFQPGRRTVQGELEQALMTLMGERVSVEVAGRTDAGVHALGQVASFRTESSRPAEVISSALNSLLPRDVSVLRAEEAAADFHPRRSARGKWYRYLIFTRRERPALYRDRAWHLYGPLDVAAMRAAAAQLVGEHDFSSFRSATCEAVKPVQELRRLEIFREGQELLAFELGASGFLKQMARIIVGTLAEVGQGKRKAEEMAVVLAARDRRRAGVTAPAHGLYLARVDYD